MSEIELETEFGKINLEEGSLKPKDEPGVWKCDCKKIMKLSEHNTGNSLKVKDRRKNLIKPSRLKVIGSCLARKSRNSSNENSDTAEGPKNDIETFTSEAFLKMRINPQEALTHSVSSPIDEKEDKLSSASQPNSCSAQAKLQHQFSSEFDSTIDEMSEWMSYHLNLYKRDKSYLVDSMYT